MKNKNLLIIIIIVLILLYKSSFYFDIKICKDISLQIFIIILVINYILIENMRNKIQLFLILTFWFISLVTILIFSLSLLKITTIPIYFVDDFLINNKFIKIQLEFSYNLTLQFFEKYVEYYINNLQDLTQVKKEFFKKIIITGDFLDINKYTLNRATSNFL